MDYEDKIKHLNAKVNFAFGDAIDQTIDSLVEFLDDAFENVQSDDAGNKKASINIPVRFQLRREAPNNYNVKVRVLAKKIETVTGEAEVGFNPDQPELDLEDQVEKEKAVPAAPVKGKRGRPKKGEVQAEVTAPGDGEFYFAATDSGELDTDDLDAYFSSSNRWKDYAGWISAGNAAQAAKIVDDGDECKRFVELVKATLTPAE